MSAAAPSFADLMARNRFPDDVRSLAIAGCLAQALQSGRRPLVRGLSQASFDRMLRTCFAGVELRNGSSPGVDEADLDEFDDLLALLLEHRADGNELGVWLSCCVASASMDDRHLWQDMGLPSRAILSRLLATSFPELAARNTGDMKWKKFFYRQLCQRAGLSICRSPNCSDCSDYFACFGPELALTDPTARLHATQP
jgi:nitrogen fixation protein NifQ